MLTAWGCCDCGSGLRHRRADGRRRARAEESIGAGRCKKRLLPVRGNPEHIVPEGRSVELLVSYEPSFLLMANGGNSCSAKARARTEKGFSGVGDFSTDLHSLGQYIQNGTKILFETVVLVDDTQKDITVGRDPQDIDGLNFLSGHLKPRQPQGFRGHGAGAYRRRGAECRAEYACRGRAESWLPDIFL